MKRQIIFGTMLSAVIATGVAAQQPPARAGTRSASAGRTVERLGTDDNGDGLSRCRTGGATSTAPGAAPGAGAHRRAQGGIMLNNATTGTMAKGSSPRAPRSGPGATGTSGRRAGATYRLVGGDSEDLQKNVGKKVEVTGSVAAKRGAGRPSADAGAGRLAPAARGGSGGEVDPGDRRELQSVVSELTSSDKDGPVDLCRPSFFTVRVHATRSGCGKPAGS